jgi:hypothetical protein
MNPGVPQKRFLLAMMSQPFSPVRLLSGSYKKIADHKKRKRGKSCFKSAQKKLPGGKTEYGYNETE